MIGICHIERCGEVKNETWQFFKEVLCMRGELVCLLVYVSEQR